MAAAVERWMADEDRDEPDPFGKVVWPGAVAAARALRDHEKSIAGAVVACVGCGPGLEALAAARLGVARRAVTKLYVACKIWRGTGRGPPPRGAASRPDRAVAAQAARVLALDYSADARSLCARGAREAGADAVEPVAFDVFKEALPPCDVIVVADVFYDRSLAVACGDAVGVALRAARRPLLVATDSQRYAGHGDAFLAALGAKNAAFRRSVVTFEGSGLLVEEDQRYDASVDAMVLDFSGADDVVFTTARWEDGDLLSADAHFSRLERGAAAAGIPAHAAAAVRAAARDAISEAALDGGGLVPRDRAEISPPSRSEGTRRERSNAISRDRVRGNDASSPTLYFRLFESSVAPAGTRRVAARRTLRGRRATPRRRRRPAAMRDDALPRLAAGRRAGRQARRLGAVLSPSGYSVETRVAATPRRRREYSVETSRGDAAAAT